MWSIVRLFSSSAPCHAGGNVVYHWLFDNGAGEMSIAGDGGKMWATLQQVCRDLFLAAGWSSSAVGSGSSPGAPVVKEWAQRCIIYRLGSLCPRGSGRLTHAKPGSLSALFALGRNP